MCDFPINSFLFWKVDNAENKNQYKYYQFLTKYIEYYHETADSFNTNGVNDFCAVLDGQQRLSRNKRNALAESSISIFRNKTFTKK